MENKNFSKFYKTNSSGLSLIVLIIVVVVIIAIATTVIVVSVNKDAKTQTNNGNNINNEVVENKDQVKVEEDDKSESKGITVSKVKNAPETDASAFEYEDIEGGISITRYTGSDEIVIIPEQIDGQIVKELGDGAFSANEIIKGIKLADSITRIGELCFGNCYNLEVVICGDDLRIIDKSAFNYCESLHTLDLNENIETLARLCLSGTDNLKEIYIPANVVTIDAPVIPSDTNVTIITEAGSAAEQYAKENGIQYKIVEGDKKYEKE